MRTRYVPLRSLASSILYCRPKIRPRCFSTEASIAPPPLPPSSGHARLTNRRLVFFHGPDVPQYLQGLTTQNIPASICQNGPRALYSGFLTAKGQVLFDVFIYPTNHSKLHSKLVGMYKGCDADPGLLIEGDADEIQAMAHYLNRFRLKRQFHVRVLNNDECEVWSEWGANTVLGEGDIGGKDDRAPGMGRRLLLFQGERPPMAGNDVGLGGYTVRRMLNGVAEGQSEMRKMCGTAQEVNLDLMNGVDFKKGCYMGQELTIRTHHQGVARKRILPCQIYASGDESGPPENLVYDPNADLPLPPPHTDMRDTDRFPKRSVGKWRAGIGNIGLAVCRLQQMTGVDHGIKSYHYRPDSQFEMHWYVQEGIYKAPRSVKVKAFLPLWHSDSML